MQHVEGVEAFFTKGNQDEVVNIYYDPETNKMTAIQRTKFDELMDKVKVATKECDLYDGDKYADCVSNIVLADIQKIADSKSLMIGYRDIMSNRLRDYICQDETVNATTAAKTIPFYHKVDDINQPYQVDTLLEGEPATIYYVDDFITEKECALLEAHHNTHGQTSQASAKITSSVFDFSLNHAASAELM